MPLSLSGNFCHFGLCGAGFGRRSLVAIFQFPFRWGRDRFDCRQRPVRRAPLGDWSALTPLRSTSGHLFSDAPPRSTTPAFVAGATSQSDPLLLLDPGIGHGLGEARDREVRRRGAIDDRRNDAGRKEGKGGEQADVPFALPLTLGNLGERANAAEPDV